MRAKRRFEDGKEHVCWSVVENCRNCDGRAVQRQVLHLGEINDSQRAAWCRPIEALGGDPGPASMALFADDREAPETDCEVVRVRVGDLSLHRPRQWGACWLALTLRERLDLDRFWRPRLPPSRQGARWLDVLKSLACHQLIDPGSEWRLHRRRYGQSAMRDLLDSPMEVVADDTPCRCLDKLVAHKRAFFSSPFLRERWETLFDARFDVLLYDLASTYFESDPPFLRQAPVRLDQTQTATAGTATAPDLGVDPAATPSERFRVVPTFRLRQPGINRLRPFWRRVAEVGPAGLRPSKNPPRSDG